MKNIVVLLVLAILTQFAYAQSKNMNTARNHLNTYLNYDKAESKTVSLEKAQVAIDAAVEEVKALQAANDPKLKPNTVAKVYSYKAQIYSEMAAVPNSPMTADATEKAVEAAKISLEADKSVSTVQNIQILDGARIKVFNDGITGYENGEYEKAYHSFTKAAAISDILAQRGLGGIDSSSIAMSAYSAQNAGKADEAIAIYERLIAMQYNDVQIYQQLATLYMAKGEDAKGAATIEAGKARYPASKDFLIAEINSLLKAGKQQEAVAKMEEAASLFPDNPSLYFALGSTYEGIPGMKDKAESYYQKALNIKPDFFDALYNIGALFYNEAAEKVKQANELPLNKQKEYDVLTKEAQALFSKALPFFDKALGVEPNDMNTLIALKEIHANLGDMKKSGEYKARFEGLKNK
ncbi:MAG TPA: hypothetical protein PK239_08495 [Chitinophagales bacterium]|nr:hypothetical protein [Chitinophagales bacterium]HRK27314.1 hypothetical protein [Chitinophagales bacterium]